MRRLFWTGVGTGLLAGLLAGWELGVASRRPSPPSIVPQAAVLGVAADLRPPQGRPWQAPKDWVPRTINGQTYWIVPLAGGHVVAVASPRSSG